LPALVAIVAGIAINSLWSMPAWALLPVVLLSSRGVTISVPAARWIIGIAIGLPIVMVLVAPAIAVVMHRSGKLPVSAQSRLLSAQVERDWRAVTDKPLRYIDGNVAFSIAIYAEEMPRALPELPPVPADVLNHAGWAMACIVEDGKCMYDAEVLQRRRPDTRRSEVTIARSFFGFKGRAQRYAILVVPPQP
jgi:hypothetical protein